MGPHPRFVSNLGVLSLTLGQKAQALAECMADADLPPGVVNLVTGPGPLVGDEIARNPGTRAVAFIGSTPTGRSVASAAAGKAVVIEMGGNGPVVVMDDADVERAVERRGGGLLPVRRPELHGGRADPRARGRARRVRRPPGAHGDRDDPARRPVRRRHDDGPGEQRRRRGQDGRARGRRGRPRRSRRGRRLARRGVPDQPVLGAHGARRRAGGFARGDGGDVRPDRPGRVDLLARGGDRADQRVAVRAAVGDLHAQPRRRACGSPTRSAPAG